MFITARVTLAGGDGDAKDLAIFDQWSGDFAVADLTLLPEGQRQSSTGYIDEQKAFATVWQAFKPGQTIPVVDFKHYLDLFSRNVDYHNLTQIFKVTLGGGAAEVLAMETMSALPIEDKVAMALAIVPRNGVKIIRTREQQIPVADKRQGSDRFTWPLYGGSFGPFF